MILRFTNVKTGLVQSVIEGSRLHRLVAANATGYVPVVDPAPKPKKEAAKPAVSVASTNAKVTISPGKAKD